MITKTDIINLAWEEVGYKGKKTNNQLYDKEANTSGKWNKYAQELFDSGEYYNAPKNGYNYCAIFMDWLFYHQAGNNAEEAKRVKPYNLYNPSVYWSYKAYLDINRTGSDPEVGAQVFFKDKDGDLWAHTGLVVKVDDNSITTVEGNWGNNVVSRVFKIDDPIIICYGYPLYDPEPEPDPEPQPQPPVEDWKTLAEWADLDGKTLRLQKQL